MTANEKIVWTAALMLKAEQTELPADMRRFRRAADELAKMNVQYIPLVMFARKILEGKRYWVGSDDREMIKRARSLADVLGAVVTQDRDEYDGSTTLIFAPPSPQ